MNIQQQIWRKFHIHGHDNVPFHSWLPDANRSHLAELFNELNFTKGAEIGVRAGYFSRELLRTNPNLSLLCIDTWAAYGKCSQQKQDQFYRSCRRRLNRYKATLMKMTSMEALDHISDESLDFVYIDGMHDFDFVMQDIIEWSKKVRVGGIVSGHDYYTFYKGGVITAVDAYTKAHKIKLWYITNEKEPSWFWVKE